MSSTIDKNVDTNSRKEKDDGREEVLQQQQQQQSQQQTPITSKKKKDESHYQSGMRPSIVTTINNTSPNINNNTNTAPRNRQRTNEPYESYIEDSFVGHWEHEDDEDEYQEDFDAESHDGCEEGASELNHPSTIEFDFDSFGPESIIYSPPATSSATTISSPTKSIPNTAQSAASTNTLTTTTTTTNTTNMVTATTTSITTTTAVTTSTNTAAICRPPPLLEVSQEAERADELTQAEVKSATQTSDSSRNETPTPNADNELASPSRNSRALNRRLPAQEYLVDPAQIDLKVIEPYKKVISHAGYCNHFDPSVPGEPVPPGVQPPAVIVFSACYLPDRSRRDYNYVMDHLFLYVLTSLHELIADDYILIYLHNTQPPNPSVNQTSSASTSAYGHSPNNLPTFTWMKRCYQMLDRRLRKNLRILYLVKPTFWLKTVVIMCKPFISAKFSRKLRFVEEMNALRKCLPVDKLILPASAENL